MLTDVAKLVDALDLGPSNFCFESSSLFFGINCGVSHIPLKYNIQEYSSVVEHTTADREVTGSNPVAPLWKFLFVFFFDSNI